MTAAEEVRLEVGTRSALVSVRATVEEWHRLCLWLESGTAATFRIGDLAETGECVLVRRHIAYAKRVPVTGAPRLPAPRGRA